MEGALLDLTTSADQRDQDWNGVAQGEANDTDTGEGIESDGCTKVDETKEELDNHAEHHGVEGHIELDVDHLPPLEAGNGTVTRECPRGARRGSGAADTADQTEDKERNEKTDRCTRAAHGVFDDGRHWLTRDKGEQVGLVGQDKHEWDEEDEAHDGVECDGTDKCLGHLGRRVLYFFTHPIPESAWTQSRSGLPQ